MLKELTSFFNHSQLLAISSLEVAIATSRLHNSLSAFWFIRSRHCAYCWLCFHVASWACV